MLRHGPLIHATSRRDFAEDGTRLGPWPPERNAVAVKITTRAIKAHLPADRRGSLTDSEIVGLQLRGSSRSAQWSLRLRLAGQRQRIDLGPYPALSPDAAREAARVWIGRVARGEDVAAELNRTRTLASGMTLDELIGVMVDRKTTRSRVNVAYEMRLYLAPLLRRPAASLTRADLLPPIRAKQAKHPATGGRLLRITKALLSWAAAEGLLEANAFATVRAPQVRSRDRTPSLEEVRAIYAAAGELGQPFAAVFRVLVLTAQRRTETARLRWRQLDSLDTDRPIWRVDAAETKNGQTLDIPLSAQAAELLQGLRSATPHAAADHFVFTTRGGARPVSGFGKVKVRLDAKLPTVEPWTPHDLRRSFATEMAQRGWPAEVINKALNHQATSTGTVVSRVYNRASLFEQRAELAQVWADLATQAPR